MIIGIRHFVTALLLMFLAIQGAAAATAKAVAFVANGFVIAATVVDGGAGYRKAPAVGFFGGNGMGAKAHSEISAQGSVTNIVMENAGSGYSSTPDIVIDPPDTLGIRSVYLAPVIVITNAADQIIDVQTSDIVDGTNWITLTNLLVTVDPFVFIDLTPATAQKRFYRAQKAVPTGIPLSNMVAIPHGSFLMGSPASEAGHQGNEEPQTVVTISRDFYMGKYEVTHSLYSEIMNTNATAADRTNQSPIVNVSWFDATNFCGKLTDRERGLGHLPNGMIYRLPTEAEWEYAARAGSTTAYFFGNDSQPLVNYAWFGSSTIHDVGLKLPNPWGLYDIYGNVWEWTADWASDKLPGGSQKNPTGNSAGTVKVGRGGDMAEADIHCRSAFRGSSVPETSVPWLGFRIVLASSIP
jgi:formylglycine-generating enzyme required for sulfatase activity